MVAGGGEGNVHDLKLVYFNTCHDRNVYMVGLHDHRK